MGLLGTLFSALDAPRQAVWDTIGTDPEQVVGSFGIDPDSWGGTAATFGLNMATDPLNYVPISGAGAYLGASKLLSKLRGGADDAVRLLDDTVRLSDDAASQATRISPTDVWHPVEVVGPSPNQLAIERELFNPGSLPGHRRSIEDAFEHLPQPDFDEMRRLQAARDWQILGDMHVDPSKRMLGGTLGYMPDEVMDLLPDEVRQKYAEAALARAAANTPTQPHLSQPIDKLVEGGYMGQGVQDITGPEGGLLNLLKASDSEIAADLARVPPELIENPMAGMQGQNSSFLQILSDGWKGSGEGSRYFDV